MTHQDYLRRSRERDSIILVAVLLLAIVFLLALVYTKLPNEENPDLPVGGTCPSQFSSVNQNQNAPNFGTGMVIGAALGGWFAK